MNRYSAARYKTLHITKPQLYAGLMMRSAIDHAKRVRIVLDHYGRKCECCGETEPKFLTIDHIEEIGSLKKRLEMRHNTMYAWLVKNNFPPGYRLLCSNCNHGRARNGGICPHKDGSQAIAQASSSKRSEVPETPTQGQDMVESSGKPEAVHFGSWSDNTVWPMTPQ